MDFEERKQLALMFTSKQRDRQAAIARKYNCDCDCFGCACIALQDEAKNGKVMRLLPSGGANYADRLKELAIGKRLSRRDKRKLRRIKRELMLQRGGADETVVVTVPIKKEIVVYQYENPNPIFEMEL